VGGGGGGSAGGGNAGSGTTGSPPVVPSNPAPEPGPLPLNVVVQNAYSGVVPANQVANAVIAFDGIASASGTQPVSFSYLWDFGDGSTAQGSGAAHQFSTGGSFQVTLSANGDNGQKGSSSTPWKVSNARMTYIAGAVGGPSFADGKGSQARFQGGKVATDKEGNIYVADNRTVRKVTPDGTTTTLAGVAELGASTDGLGANARFTAPGAITVDSNNNVFVLDHTVLRKISPAGQVSTIVDTNKPEHTTGGRELTVDRAGNIYATTLGAVLKISNGQISTWAGKPGESGWADGNAGAARFNDLGGITIDSDDNLYVRDGCYGIRKIAPDATVTSMLPNTATYAGQPCNGWSIAIDANKKLFVSRDSDILTVDRFGSPGQILATSANGRSLYAYPKLAMAANGELIVSDQNYAIRKVNTTTGADTVLAGVMDDTASAASNNGLFSRVSNMARLSDGTLLVADFSCIRAIRSASAPTVFAGECNSFSTGNDSPTTPRFGSSLSGMAVDGQNNVFVADLAQKIIRKIAPDGTASTYAGNSGVTGSADGPRLTATFQNPGALTFDGLGNLWLLDSGALRLVTPAGEVKTVLSSALAALECPAPAPSSPGCGISSMQADKVGNVYVTVDGSFAKPSVFKITQTGQATKFFTSNLASSLSMTGARLAIDPQGLVWLVSSTGFNFGTIQKLSAAGESVDVVYFGRFATPVTSGGPGITFDRSSAESAVFNTDGSLFLSSNGTIFQMAGLP
jgi:sugar lactone lactonase YvrE